MQKAPSSELHLHLQVYQASEAQAVVHTHAPYATALSTVYDHVPPIHYITMMLGGKIPVAPYATFGTTKLADSILSANHIAVWATGASAPFGLYLNQRLMRLGYVSTFLSDSHEMEVQSKVLRKDTLILAISRTGWPGMLVEACAIAKSRGCKLCVITGQQGTEL